MLPGLERTTGWMASAGSRIENGTVGGGGGFRVMKCGGAPGRGSLNGVAQFEALLATSGAGAYVPN
jgi:hypothetical protein